MTPFTQTAFNNFIINNQVVKISSDPLRLRSGQFSHIDLNWQLITNDAYLLDLATDYILQYTKDHNFFPTCYLGLPEESTKTALITSYKLAKQSADFKFNSHFLPMGRGDVKVMGNTEDRHFIGLPKDRETIVVEDITITGGSLLTFIDTLLDSGVNVTAAFTMINRMQEASTLPEIFEKRYGESCKFYALTTLGSIANTMVETNLLSDDQRSILLNELNSTSTMAA